MKTSHALAEAPLPAATSPINARRATLAGRVGDQSEPIWEPYACTHGAPTTDQVLHLESQQIALSVQRSSAILATINRPLRADEGHKDGNDNKERELRAIFRELTPQEALAIRRRLASNRTGDELVVAFKRLTAERRTRLITFLADPRRQYL